MLDLRIENEGIRREEAPRRFTHIHLHFILFSPHTSAEEFGKVVKLAVEKYCSISASLAADMELTYTAEIKKTFKLRCGDSLTRLYLYIKKNESS